MDLYQTNRLVTILMAFSLLRCGEEKKPNETKYFEITDYSPEDTLFMVSRDSLWEIGDEFAYVNQKGDTIFPFGHFSYSFTDPIITYGIVVQQIDGRQEFIGINQQGQRLFEPITSIMGLTIFRRGPFGFGRTEKLDMLIVPEGSL